MTSSRGRRPRRDGGSITVEFAILLPAFLALIALAVVAGRTMIAQSAIDIAAHDAARAASISRDAVTAKTRAEAAARDTLRRQGLACAQLTVTVDTSQFARPVGQPAAVQVRIACRVTFHDIGFPGVPADRRLEASFTSPLDQYRTRR